MGDDKQENGPVLCAQAYAFLFDGSVDGVPSPQLGFFTEAVLAGLSKADPEGETRSRLLTGVPMLHLLARRVTAVRASGRSSGHTESHDSNTYKYVIWDWLDSLSSTWSSVLLGEGEKIFRRHSGECVTLVSLTSDRRDSINKHLQDIPGYIGAFEVDPGNPIHRIGFVDVLTYPAAVVSGAIVQERNYEGDEDWPLQGAASFAPNGLKWRPMGWLEFDGPPSLAKSELSHRGAVAVERYHRKHGETVEGRILRAIQGAYRRNSERQDFDFIAVGNEGDILQALMPEGKFTSYLFNREHKKGGPKSKFFIDVLGIDPDDWRYLAAQFYFGILNSQPTQLTFSEWPNGYGIRFDVDMVVRGRSGKAAVVQTGWMLTPGKLPSLSSAMPGKRAVGVPGPVDPLILRPGVRGDAEWALLWQWANATGMQSAAETVPTPMFIVDFDPIAEGECGTAAVRIGDARRGLPRWLRKQGIATADSYGGAVVFSPVYGQSLDRARAWARGVMLTLKLNGINAEMEDFID